MNHQQDTNDKPYRVTRNDVVIKHFASYDSAESYIESRTTRWIKADQAIDYDTGAVYQIRY